MEKKTDSKSFTVIAKFFTPIILGLGVLGSIGFFMNMTLRGQYWALITGYFFPPFGKETIIPTGITLGINPVIMALSIAFVDVVVALFLVWNYDLAKKIPFIGKFIVKVEEKGKNVEEKYGWIKPLRFIGIVLFVIVPFQGSGGLVGSIVGRLIGMKPWNTFFAISIGAVSGCLMIAFFTQTFLTFAKINTTLTLALIGVIVIVAVLYFCYTNVIQNVIQKSRKKKK